MPLTPEEQRELDELELEELEAEERKFQQPRQMMKKQPTMPVVEAAARGVASALSPISKYGEAAGISLFYDVPWDIAVETAEEAEQQSKEERPGAYYGGMGAGVLGGIGASLPAKIPSAAKLLGIGGLTGAAQTAGTYPYQQAKEEPGELLKAAGTGGLFGAGVSAIPLAIGGRGPLLEGAKAGMKAAEGKDLVSGVISGVSEAIPATYGAGRETRAFKEAVEQIAPKAASPTTVGQFLRQGAQVTPEEEAQFLLNLLQPGKTPAKEFYTQKATQLYPTQMGPQQLEKVLQIPLEQRVQARQFDPSAMGRELLPQAQAAKQALGKKGAAFQELQELASQEYKRTQLPTVSNAIKLAKAQYERPGTSALARNTIEEIDTIINQGSALPRYGVTEGPLKSANAQEAYKRLQAAREYADRAIRKNRQDLSVQDVLMPLRDSLDEVLKSSPSKVIADALYAKGQRVTQLGITPLEMPISKTERILSGKAIQSALGDTQRGEKLSLGIEEARKFTKQFGAQLGPTETAKIDSFFDALADARTVADRKRILNELKFVEGPSGAAIRAGIEKLQQTIKPAPGGASMFRAAPEYLQSVDAFMADKARQFFNKPYDKLTGDQQYKLVNAYQWFKENPNATMQEMNEAFTRILKGSRK